MKMIDNISKELLNLLYYIKELAINQAPISLDSLLNSIVLVGYACFLDDERKYPKVEILEIEQNEYGCNNRVCTLSIKFINDYDVIIDGCSWIYIKDLEYDVDDNGRITYHEHYVNGVNVMRDGKCFD